MKRRTKKYSGPKRNFSGGGLLALLKVDARGIDASPLREDQISDLGRNYWLSFTNLTQGSASFESWENCVGSLNMGLVLAEKVFDGQGEQEIVAALDGLFKAKLRGDKTGRYRLDGEGIQAVREALELHDQQMKLAHRREIVDSIATVKKRVAEGNVYQVQAQV